MGKGGVALPDMAQAGLFNPALPALSFPWDKTTFILHPTWMNIFHEYLQSRAWNGPFPGMTGMGSNAGSVARVPSAYVPRLGYIAYDLREYASHRTWSNDGFQDRTYSLTFSPAVD